MRTSMRTTVVVVGFVALLPACTEPEEPALVGEAAAQIYNAGDGLAAPDNGAHPQVFTFSGPTNTACTASLIASNAVLTVGHCVGTGSGPAQVFTKDTGTFTVNVAFNASPSVAAQLAPLGTWTTTDPSVFPHPLFQNINATSVDVAVLVMPSSVPRCAMKPLKVVDTLPSPTIDPQNQGKLNAWAGIFVRLVGAGRTGATCTGPFDTSVSTLLNIMGGVVQSDVPPFQPVFFLPFPGLVSNKSHSCPGDSGGPILSTDIDDIFGTNIPKDLIVSMDAEVTTGAAQDAFSPVLQTTDLRSWLLTTGLDRDGDGKEAAEDNCDTVANSDQADDDGDGIGNACDAVPGMDDCADQDNDGLPNYMDPCPNDPTNSDPDGDSLCADADPCPNDPTNTDPDNDGVCGAADNCPNVANAGQENCNADAEAAAGVPPVGDACDPVPCVRAAQAAQTSGNQFLKVTRTTFFDIEPIRAMAPKFAGEWGHRFCDCPIADGTPEAPAACAQKFGCAISNVDFAPDGPKWEHTLVGIKEPPQLDATFVDDFAQPAELQPGGVAATLETLTWDASPNNAALEYAVTGSHWFHVKKQSCANKPCVPSLPQVTLDTLASHFWAGEAGQYFAIGNAAEIPNIFDWWSPPEPDCTVCGPLEILPFAYVRPDDTLAIRTPAGDYSIENELTPAAIAALKTTTGVRWLAPSEPARLLHGFPIRLASILVDGSEAGPALRSTPLGIDVVTPVIHQSPPPRSQFGSFLRATRGDVLVLGGVLQAGGLAGDVWRYDIAADHWVPVHTDGLIVPGAVLAATYDGDADRVLVLDEMGAGAQRQARFWSLEMRGGSTHLLGAWPRTGYFDRFALGHSHDGSFILLASHAEGVPLKVMRLLVAGDAVTLDRIRTTTGAPVTAPRTNQRGIHIVVNRPAKQIVGDRIDWTSLNPPGGKTLADFVK